VVESRRTPQLLEAIVAELDDERGHARPVLGEGRPQHLQGVAILRAGVHPHTGVHRGARHAHALGARSLPSPSRVVPNTKRVNPESASGSKGPRRTVSYTTSMVDGGLGAMW
jgi:hypothetical protein